MDSVTHALMSLVHEIRTFGESIVGLSEKKAETQGIAYRLFKIPMQSVLRTRTLSETRGFLNALVEADGDRIVVSLPSVSAAGEIAEKTGISITAAKLRLG